MNTLELEGIIEKVHGKHFSVVVQQTSQQFTCLCYLSGKLVKNKINPKLGDKVRIECDGRDLTRGRITYRL